MPRGRRQSIYSEIVEMKAYGSAFNFIAPSLARIGASGKQLVAPSVELSRCALEFQIELRARLLKDIELVRSRLRDCRTSVSRGWPDFRSPPRRPSDFASNKVDLDHGQVSSSEG
jgi:hypothetical protein